MAINATNYDGTKDYKIAEVGDVYHPNIFVNGDFKVNQRGKNEYSLEGFCVDMWQTAFPTGAKVTVNDDGLSFTLGSAGTPSYFGGYAPKESVNSSHVTLCAGIDGIIYTKTVDLSNLPTGWITLNTFVKFKVEEKTVGSTFYNFSIEISKNCKFNYIDLFNGEIAYPHVREDYETTLMRCQKYYFKISGQGTTNISMGYVKHDKLIRIIYNFPTIMRSAPTVTVTGEDFVMETETGGYLYLKYNAIPGVSKEAAVIEFAQQSVIQNTSVVGSVYSISAESYIEFSCEPL